MTRRTRNAESEAWFLSIAVFREVRCVVPAPGRRGERVRQSDESRLLPRREPTCRRLDPIRHLTDARHTQPAEGRFRYLGTIRLTR